MSAIRRDFFLTAGSQLLVGALNLSSSVLIVNFAGLQEFAYYSICFLSLMITRSFLYSLLLNPISVISKKLKQPTIRPYRSFTFWLAVAFSICAACTLGVVFLALSITLEFVWMTRILPAFLATVLLMSYADYVRRVSLVDGERILSFGVETSRFLVQTAVLATAVVVADIQLTAEYALWALAAGALVSSLMGSKFLPSVRLRRSFANAIWPRHRLFFVWMFPGTVMETVQINAPMFISGAILGADDMGLIRAIQQLSNTINLPFNAMQQYLPSATARTYREVGERRSVNQLIGSMAAALLFSLAVAALVLINSDVVLSALYRIDSGEAQPVLFGYLLANVLILLRMPLVILFQVLEQPRISAVSSAIGACLAIVVSLPLCVTIGAPAVPVTNCIIISTSFLLYLSALRTRPNES